MKEIRILQIMVLVFVISGCSSLTLKPVNYAWPVESVLSIDEGGFIEDLRYSIKVNTSQLMVAEYGTVFDNGSETIRIIRNDQGFYFITSAGFKNVYVFTSSEEGLELENTINISETAMTSPVMNQRSPFIELIDGDNKYMLTHKGIEEN